MRGQGKGIEDLKDESPFKAKKYTVVKQWSFEDSKFKRVARPDIYKSSMVSCGLPGDNPRTRASRPRSRSILNSQLPLPPGLSLTLPLRPRPLYRNVPANQTDVSFRDKLFASQW